MFQSATDEFRHNHYVPEWYQRRFLGLGKSQYWYLDLKPDVCSNGKATWTRNALHRWGPGMCFAQHDLYTTYQNNTDIERFFFGKIDDVGKGALEYLASFDYTEFSETHFINFLRYMSTQKFRTPKGLGLLRQLITFDDQKTLWFLQKHRDFFCATWAECVWQIADTSLSPTKFIISDHPVTVYNRECFPDSTQCKGFNDPEIRLVGTQTYFPLGLDKVLILTNLSWIRDPYQNATKIRPNPSPYRDTLFNMTEIQTNRHLSEEEVIEINYITKRRALRYIAGAEKEWLYPEERLRDDHWRKLGDGYLLMPEPRHILMRGETFIGYKNGHSEAYSEYGHRPWQKGYEDRARFDRESRALDRFQAEWAATYGPEYRATNAAIGGGFDRAARTRESDEMHAHHLEQDAKFRKTPGERQRRRGLKRRNELATACG